MLQFRAMDEQGRKLRPPARDRNHRRGQIDRLRENSLTAVGSLVAVQGVTVAAELPGKVAEIAFQPVETCGRGDLLIRQDTGSERVPVSGAEMSQEKLGPGIQS